MAKDPAFFLVCFYSVALAPPCSGELSLPSHLKPNNIVTAMGGDAVEHGKRFPKLATMNSVMVARPNTDRMRYFWQKAFAGPRRGGGAIAGLINGM